MMLIFILVNVLNLIVYGTISGSYQPYFQVWVYQDATIIYHHIYNNIDIFYDTWSNIHFGFIGTYVGYSQEKLLNGAGEAQKISDQHLIGKIIYLALGYRTNYVNGAKYDNDIDGHLICKGVELFLTKNSNIIAHDLLNAVSNAYKRF